MEPEVQNSALLDAILEAAVDAIVVADKHGVIQRANGAAFALFGYPAGEMLGQNVKSLMPMYMAAQHDGFMQHYMETGEKRIIGIGRDVEGQRRDGAVFPLHLSVGHSRIDGQDMFVGILHDLTQRKATEDALARSQRLEAIGQMTGGIAHDFNNLLTVVIGNLELMEMRSTDSRQLGLLRDALDAAELGAELTSRLLVFARKSNLKPVRTNLGTLCEKTLAIIRRTVGPGITITTECDPDVDLVLIDPSELQSALMNLALNARDAMGKGGDLLISVSNVAIDDTYIAQEPDITPGNYVRLSVSDDGAGMSEEAQKRAFEPFFTTKSESSGTGLGLAMVYWFVKQSGGHITLYSEPGLGTSFGLYFPAITSNRSEEKTDEASVTESGYIPTQDKTILVVEDNEKVRRLSLERIRNLGFGVLEAENGDAAYAMLKNGAEVDLVFSDLVMPGELNGYDLAAKINAEYPKVKVLLTSGYASDVITGGLARSKPYDILQKPYRQPELAHRIQALLAEVNDG
ncbi:MAG: PAS domain S-box protein [Sulfitobacter sp.]|nr:PAS domain S-box protein [Sulfitobacter sp.]